MMKMCPFLHLCGTTSEVVLIFVSLIKKIFRTLVCLLLSFSNEFYFCVVLKNAIIVISDKG